MKNGIYDLASFWGFNLTMTSTRVAVIDNRVYWIEQSVIFALTATEKMKLCNDMFFPVAMQDVLR